MRQKPGIQITIRLDKPKFFLINSLTNELILNLWVVGQNNEAIAWLFFGDWVVFTIVQARLYHVVYNRVRRYI
ncbi:MAG: hypothetical protein EBT93_15765 [Alphaproteobacteria bacterium]|nr:hypothetical protein [Alphaproteobacteria bacterium]